MDNNILRAVDLRQNSESQVGRRQDSVIEIPSRQNNSTEANSTELANRGILRERRFVSEDGGGGNGPLPWGKGGCRLIDCEVQEMEKAHPVRGHRSSSQRNLSEIPPIIVIN